MPRRGGGCLPAGRAARPSSLGLIVRCRGLTRARPTLAWAIGLAVDRHSRSSGARSAASPPAGSPPTWWRCSPSSPPSSSASRWPASSWSSCRREARRSSATPRVALRGQCASSRPRRRAWPTESPLPAVEDVAADAVAVGDELLVRPGELVPCDAVVLEGRSHVDAARLTGEPLPVTRHGRDPTPERQPQPGGPAHRARCRTGAGEPVCAHRRAGAHGAGEQVAAAAAGRPLCRLVHARSRCWCAAAAYLVTRRSDARARRAGRRHAVPAHSRHARSRSWAASTARPARGSSSATARRSSSSRGSRWPCSTRPGR